MAFTTMDFKSLARTGAAGLVAFVAGCADFSKVQEEDIVGQAIIVGQPNSSLCKNVWLVVEVEHSGRREEYEACTSISLPAGTPEYRELRYHPTLQFHVVPRKQDGSFVKIASHDKLVAPYYDVTSITPTRTFPNTLDMSTNAWKFYSGRDAGVICQGENKEMYDNRRWVVRSAASDVSLSVCASQYPEEFPLNTLHFTAEQIPGKLDLLGLPVYRAINIEKVE